MRVPDIARVSKRHAIEVLLRTSSSTSSVGSSHAVSGSSGGSGEDAAVAGSSGSLRLVMSADSKEEQEMWLQSLSVASVPDGWPGGWDADRGPLPLLFSLWSLGHTHPRSSLAPAAVPPGGASRGAAALARACAAAAVPRLPALKASPQWQRKSLLLQKFRACSVTFDGAPPGVASEEREAKRNTLLEVLDFIDDASAAGSSGAGSSASSAAAACSSRAALSDARFLDDLFAMIRCNLFRALPVAPPPSGDPDAGDVAFADPLWPHLSLVYEILLRIVCDALRC